MHLDSDDTFLSMTVREPKEGIQSGFMVVSRKANQNGENG